MRRVSTVVLVALGIFLLPFGLLIASNFGAGVLDFVLNRTPTTSELLGEYAFQAPWGDSVLRLDQDGSFEQRIRSDGKIRVIQGRWQRIQQDGGEILFRPFGMVWDRDHTSDTAVFNVPFEKARFGKTFGIIDSDLGEKYIRLE